MSRTTARDLMTPDVLTVREDMTLQELAAFFKKSEITGAPVVADGGKVCGVVSLVDLARADSERPGGVSNPMVTDYYRPDWDLKLDEGVRFFHPRDLDVRVRDILQRRVHSVGGDTEVPEIARLMLTRHIHRVLVIEKGELIGMVSTTDLLGLFLEE